MLDAKLGECAALTGPGKPMGYRLGVGRRWALVAKRSFQRAPSAFELIICPVSVVAEWVADFKGRFRPGGSPPSHGGHGAASRRRPTTTKEKRNEKGGGGK